MDLSRGQRAKIQDVVGSATKFDILPAIESNVLSLDYSVFGVDAAGKLAGDEYMCFYNQPSTPCGGVRFSQAGGAQTFTIDLNCLPPKIDRLVLTASIDGAGAMSQITSGNVHFKVNGSPASRFSFAGTDFTSERALILGEVYRKDGIWRFSATAQGFAGGLDALVKHYGGEVAEAAQQSQQLVNTPSKVSLSKVTLTKPNEVHKVMLQKGLDAPKKLIVKATWIDNGDDCDDNDDLDLRVGILLPNGKMKFICAPDCPGSFDRDPYVKHLGDVTSASQNEPATEIVEVNPNIAKLCGGAVNLVFSLYSALENGNVSVAEMHPKMRMEYGNQIVECAYDFTDNDDDGVYTYVIGTAAISEESIELKPSGLTSEPGSENTPWLSRNLLGNVKITMDGPEVFKGSTEQNCVGNLRYINLDR